MRRFRLTPQLIGLAILVSSASVSLCSAQTTQTPQASQPSSAATTNGGTQPASPPPQPAAGATGPSPAEATKSAQAAISAINNAASAVSKASDAIDKAGKYAKAIQDITGSTTKSSQSVLDNLQTLQSTIDAIGQNKVLNALSTALKDLDPAQTNTPESAVRTACDKSKLQQPAGGDQQDVTNAIAKCDPAQKEAASALAATTPALTSLQSAIQSISPYLAKQFDALAATLKPFTDAKLISTDASADTSAAKGSDAAAPAANADAAKPATPAGPSPVVLLQVLPKGLPALKHVLESIGEFTAAWNALKPTIQSPGAGYTSAASGGTADGKKPPPANGAGADPDAELKKLQDSVNNIETKLAPWFAAIAGQLTADAQTLDGKLAGVAADPAKNSAEALGNVRDKTDTLAAVQSIVDAWPPLVGFLVDGQPSGFSLGTTRKNFEEMQKWTNTLRGSISRVHDALAGDFSGFETDQVSLYYFTDVQRLMYALNEGFQTMGGVAEAKAQADEQRTALTKTELELADAQASVNRFQKQVLDLQEQQRQAQAKLKGLSSNTSKLANRLNNAQDQKDQADADYNAAKTAQQAAPNDPTQTAALNKAAAQQTKAATKLSQSQSDYNAAKSDQDKTQSQVDDSQNQSDSLPAKLAAAQQVLSDAQTAVSAERRKMLLAAQAESDAFAFARDNTPFMVAFADASSSNPAKRVMLYAFNDSKNIFMRGKAADLAEVKRIIYAFDKPAPQARLTLWTFQLSADSGQKTNKKAAKQLNESMEIVDEELGDTRALENTTLARLRDIINDAVANLASVPLPSSPTLPGQDCSNLGPGYTPADCEKLKRVIQFYDPSVLKQLNFDLQSEKQPDRLQLLRKLIPDPADTTTLGEALLVVSLARPVTRSCVRNKFEVDIRERLKNLPLTSKNQTWPSEGDILALTWHALNVWDSGAPSCNFDASQLVVSATSGLGASQLEIVRALRASYDSFVLRDILNKIESWRAELGGRSTDGKCPPSPPQCPGDAGLYAKLDDIKRRISTYVERGKALLSKDEAQKLTLLQVDPDVPDVPSLNDQKSTDKARLTRKAINSLSATDQLAYDDLNREQLSLESRLDTIKKRSVYVVNTLRSYGIDAVDLLPRKAIPDNTNDKSGSNNPSSGAGTAAQPPAGQQSIVVQQSIEGVKQRILSYSGLSTASPRVAAADQMLKEIIIAVEDDLARDFVQPMITGLRTRLTRKRGVGVGVVQRESLLATNRGVARIDPRASAQLAVGDEEDILSGVQQLAQLYGAVQSGGALAALGALQQQPREPQPEIYALNTGNRFQVTPIFDPSGQALRFKFDFVATANVQEPNGTTNKQLSRIERHTVNTEVQLSNLETREISRFEVNARLGLPTTYWGGLPILKDIPHIRPWVPLVGWFVRKGGSNASAQQSVIFGQTTIYPTIGALIDLVSDPGSNPGEPAPVQ
jgi:hypothetical protein